MPPPVLVVGAGPVGLTLALELRRFDVPAIVVDEKPALEAVGSRAIVIARHALETFRRLGAADPMLAKAVALRRARTYFRQTELFVVEFPAVAPGELPLFVNLQQTYTERALLARAEELGVDVRWSTRVQGVWQDEDAVELELASGASLRGAFVAGCDGARSTIRRVLGIQFDGRSFPDRFLIADIRADLPFPEERRFYFDPPWNPGRQVLIHPQPDGEWRVDWQVPVETDAEEERRSGRLEQRIRRIIGDADYELAWLTAYRFHERIASRFRLGRAFLAGDAAHLMSVFGARGMNSGVEDARNLGWRLARVLAGDAPETLLDGYERERRAAAEENIRVTSATMRFMAPPTRMRRLLRNAILRGSLHSRTLRRRVDSGKLAEPAVYEGEPPVGRLCPEGAPVREARLGFAVAELGGGEYLVRPDGYVCARLGSVDEAIAAALVG